MWDCSFSTLFFSSWRIAYNLVNIVVFLFSLVPQPSWYMHACKQCCKPQCFQTITFPHHSLQIFSTFYWEWSEYRWDTERRQPKCSALSHMFSKSIFVCACLGWSCELLLPFFCVKSLTCSMWSRFFFFFFFLPYTLSSFASVLCRAGQSCYRDVAQQTSGGSPQNLTPLFKWTNSSL